MKLEHIFIAIFMFTTGMFAGGACGYYLIPRFVAPSPDDSPPPHRAIRNRRFNPVLEPLIDEDFPPGARRPHYVVDHKNRATGL